MKVIPFPQQESQKFELPFLWDNSTTLPPVVWGTREDGTQAPFVVTIRDGEAVMEECRVREVFLIKPFLWDFLRAWVNIFLFSVLLLLVLSVPDLQVALSGMLGISIPLCADIVTPEMLSSVVMCSWIPVLAFLFTRGIRGYYMHDHYERPDAGR